MTFGDFTFLNRIIISLARHYDLKGRDTKRINFIRLILLILINFFEKIAGFLKLRLMHTSIER